MPVPIPVMRQFKHPELKKVKLPDGIASKKELDELVRNTNFLIAKGLHVPGYRLTHDGQEDRIEHKGKALGWIENMDLADDGRVVGYSEFTELGKNLIRGKEVRWVSSGIRRDFKLTGEPDGPVLPGLYLDHVAVLGDENPAVKGLVDLSRVELSEGVQVTPGTEGFTVFEKDGEIAYFSEIDKEMTMPEPQKTPEQQKTVDIAMFNELMSKVETLTTNLSTEKTKREKAEADLETFRKEQETAKFSEYQADVKGKIKDVQSKVKFGAELSEKLQAVAEASYGTKNGVAAFNAMLDTLGKQKFGSSTTLQSDDKNQTVDEANFAEQESKLSEKDFEEAARDLMVANRIANIVRHRQEKDKTFSYTKLHDEVRNRSRVS